MFNDLLMFNSILFGFYVFVFFEVSFSVVDFYSHSFMVLEKMLDMVSLFLNLLRIVLWPNTCDLALLRNLYVDQEATVRTLHGTTDSSKLRKEYNKVVCRHPVF